MLFQNSSYKIIIHVKTAKKYMIPVQIFAIKNISCCIQNTQWHLTSYLSKYLSIKSGQVCLGWEECSKSLVTTSADSALPKVLRKVVGLLSCISMTPAMCTEDRSAMAASGYVDISVRLILPCDHFPCGTQLYNTTLSI